MKSLINKSSYSFYTIFLLLITYFMGFIFNENSSGGAYKDFINQSIVVNAFSENFFQTFLNYDDYNTRHSPIFIIFLSLFKKINLSDDIIRFLHFIICLSLPYLFFKCLKIRFSDIDDQVLYFLTGIIFLSPTFRSLSVWPDSRIFGTIFFLLSVLYYLKFLKNGNFRNILLNTFFLIISSYISPNFSLFSIFFITYYFTKLGLSKKFLFILLLNFILALPAFYYLFILDINFLSIKAVDFASQNISQFNVANKILIISTILFFYIVPFYFICSFNKNIEYSNINKILLTLIIFLICLFYFDYSKDFGGGGFYFKISYFLFQNLYLFFVISFVSIFFLILKFGNNFWNYLIITILILSNVQYTIYHKYYDPLALIIFFFLIKTEINLKRLNNIKYIFFVYIYYITFLVINLFKYKIN